MWNGQQDGSTLFYVQYLHLQDTVHKTDMDALSNVNTRRGGTDPPCVGETAGIAPQAQDTATGVSVEYAPDPAKRWFVLRATYHREAQAYAFITRRQTEAYLPVHYVQKIVNGKKKRLPEPLLSNILFVYAAPETVDSFLRMPELSYLNYYYDHFTVGEDGKNPPLTVGYGEMMNFIRVTRVESEHVRLVDPAQCHYKSGDRVEIIDGDFLGVRGRVARVAGQQRVVVELEGLCLLATAYIPRAFLRAIE